MPCIITGPFAKFIDPPGMNDFPEDWEEPVYSQGLYMNRCRRCGELIQGHKHRRTCRYCVGVLQREAERMRRDEAQKPKEA